MRKAYRISHSEHIPTDAFGVGDVVVHPTELPQYAGRGAAPKEQFLVENAL